MMTALQRLHKFVGAEARRNLQQSLQRGDYDNFVRYLLTTHYDARYRSHPPNIIHTIKANTIEQAQKLLKEWLSERHTLRRTNRLHRFELGLFVWRILFFIVTKKKFV